MFPIIFAHWIGQTIVFLYLFFMTLFFVLNRIQNKIFSFNLFIIYPLSILILFFILNFNKLLVSPSNLNIKYSFQYLSLFLLLIIFLFIPKIKKIKINQIGKIIFWTSFLTIFIEFILVNFLGVSKAIFPTSRMESITYYADVLGWHRPWGLTGQTSANGGILLLAYLFLYEMKFVSWKYNLTVFVGTLMTISGQAILTGVVILFLIMLKNFKMSKPVKTLLLIFFSLTFYLFLQADLFQKVSLEYIFLIFLQQLHIDTTLMILSPFQWITGALGDIQLMPYKSSEIQPIMFIHLWGVPLTLLFWFMIYMFVLNTDNPLLWFASIFVSSLHYPTILYIEAQLIVCLLLIYSLNKNYSKNDINSYRQFTNFSKE